MSEKKIIIIAVVWHVRNVVTDSAENDVYSMKM